MSLRRIRLLPGPIVFSDNVSQTAFWDVNAFHSTFAGCRRLPIVPKFTQSPLVATFF